jgi:hypothetical protein
MIERIHAGQDSTGAMPEQKHGKVRVSRFHDVHERRDIAHVVGERGDVEPFAVGPATSTEVYGIRGVAHGRESLSHPGVVPAVRIETGHDHDAKCPTSRPTLVGTPVLRLWCKLPLVIDASALQMLLITVTGWLDDRERQVLAYLIEENRVLRRQVGRRRLRLTDQDRRTLAARAY